ncbi:putative membrane protein [Acinetobacter baumannii]|nr:putative membrane protein [Acinetobacter baumannii]
MYLNIELIAVLWGSFFIAIKKLILKRKKILKEIRLMM